MLRTLFVTVCLLTAPPALAADLAETSTSELPSANLPLPVRNVLAHRQLPTDTLSLFVFNLKKCRSPKVFGLFELGKYCMALTV